MDQAFILNQGSKFDIQLATALVRERELAEILTGGARIKGLSTIELKTETYLWQRTGNIAVEYEWNSKPSGIAVTEADFWMHELRRLEPLERLGLQEGQRLGYFLFPHVALLGLCRRAWSEGRKRENVGDDGLSSIILLKLTDLLRPGSLL